MKEFRRGDVINISLGHREEVSEIVVTGVQGRVFRRNGTKDTVV